MKLQTIQLSNHTSEPIADIQPDITSEFRQAGDTELLFSSCRHAPFQQPLAERPVHAVQQVLGDEPQFGVTFNAQLAVEEQGVGVFLIEIGRASCRERV